MNAGNLRIGDSLTEDKAMSFPGIPRFQAEHFGILRCAPSSRKAFNKGMEELLQEGAIQGFKDPHSAGNDLLLGAVGPLQFEVLQYRLENEYGAKTDLEKLPYRLARWVQGPEAALEALRNASTCRLAQDLDGQWVGLFRDTWSMEGTLRNHDKLKFLIVAPVK
jgi:peptide chain release factor 3